MTKKDLSLEARKKLLNKFKFGKFKAWDKVPVTDKKNINKIGTPANFSELRITSGSTGDPLYVFYSKDAVDSFVRRAATSLKKSGVTKKDIVLNLFAYGNYVPGSMYEIACLKEDFCVLPLGAPNTYSKEKVVDCIIRTQPTVWLSVPSYALGLLAILESTGNGKYKPRKIIVAGEKLLEAYIKKFSDFGVEIFNHFGLTECPAIGISRRDNPRIVDVLDDDIYVEAIPGESGLQLAVTDLKNFSTPIIRYDTHDIIRDVKFRKDGSVKGFVLEGRSDDLLKLQGTLTSKTKIVDTLMGYTPDFFITISTRDNRDVVSIMIDEKFKDRETEIMNSLSFIICKKEIGYGSQIEIPKTTSQKLRYILDSRK